MNWTVLHGDCLDRLAGLPAESIDACVTDPPYGIGFMGKEWDTFKPENVASAFDLRQRKEFKSGVMSANIEGRKRSPAASPSQVQYDYSVTGLRGFQLWTEAWAREVFRVMKPGAHAVVCGAPRAYHRMACGLEDAGFEIRDCLAWLFGSGFPKSLNLGEGLGTALKPAHEPIVLARKPFKGTVRANVDRFGTGALNINAARIEAHDLGRWPANVALDEIAAMVLDEQSGNLVSGGFPLTRRADKFRNAYGTFKGAALSDNPRDGDMGSASRFYYVAKPSREERDYGCSGLAQHTAGEYTDRKEGSDGLKNPRAGAGRTGGGRNFHPTVKPVELMRWLVKLVTPPNGTVLDPFTGSGTTGMACRYEQRNFIGIEREAEYLAIANARIGAVAPLFNEVAGWCLCVMSHGEEKKQEKQ